MIAHRTQAKAEQLLDRLGEIAARATGENLFSDIDALRHGVLTTAGQWCYLTPRLWRAFEMLEKHRGSPGRRRSARRGRLWPPPAAMRKTSAPARARAAPGARRHPLGGQDLAARQHRLRVGRRPPRRLKWLPPAAAAVGWRGRQFWAFGLPERSSAAVRPPQRVYRQGARFSRCGCRQLFYLRGE